MHLLEEYLMRRPEEMKLFRRHVHNIMDWGLLKRKAANDKLYGGLVAMYGPSGSESAPVSMDNDEDTNMVL